MSSSGLDVIDKTVQTTNIWLNEVMDDMGPDRQVAWHILGAVLRTLRDRMQPELASHLGAQLPLLVRGVYYDQYQPEKMPEVTRSVDEFLSCIGDELSDTRPVNAVDATRSVFHVLSRHLSPGQAEKIREALPKDIRALWPEDFLSARAH